MIVVLVLIVMFVVGTAVAKSDFTSEPCFGKEFKGAIDGGLADRGIFFLDEPVQVFAGEVVFGLQEDVEYDFALSGTLKPLLLDMAMEYFLFFGHILTRNLITSRIACEVGSTK